MNHQIMLEELGFIHKLEKMHIELKNSMHIPVVVESALMAALRERMEEE